MPSPSGRGDEPRLVYDDLFSVQRSFPTLDGKLEAIHSTVTVTNRPPSVAAKKILIGDNDSA